MGIAEARSAQRQIQIVIDTAVVELALLVAAMSAELAALDESRQNGDELVMLDAHRAAATLALGSLRSASELMHSRRSQGGFVGNG